MNFNDILERSIFQEAKVVVDKEKEREPNDFGFKKLSQFLKKAGENSKSHAYVRFRFIRDILGQLPDPTSEEDATVLSDEILDYLTRPGDVNTETRFKKDKTYSEEMVEKIKAKQAEFEANGVDFEEWPKLYRVFFSGDPKDEIKGKYYGYTSTDFNDRVTTQIYGTSVLNKALRTVFKKFEDEINNSEWGKIISEHVTEEYVAEWYKTYLINKKIPLRTWDEPNTSQTNTYNDTHHELGNEDETEYNIAKYNLETADSRKLDSNVELFYARKHTVNNKKPTNPEMVAKVRSVQDAALVNILVASSTIPKKIATPKIESLENDLLLLRREYPHATSLIENIESAYIKPLLKDSIKGHEIIETLNGAIDNLTEELEALKGRYKESSSKSENVQNMLMDQIKSTFTIGKKMQSILAVSINSQQSAIDTSFRNYQTENDLPELGSPIDFESHTVDFDIIFKGESNKARNKNFAKEFDPDEEISKAKTSPNIDALELVKNPNKSNSEDYDDEDKEYFKQKEREELNEESNLNMYIGFLNREDKYRSRGVSENRQTTRDRLKPQNSQQKLALHELGYYL